MNHVELGLYESWRAMVSDRDRAWSRFCNAVGEGVGGNYDGDGEENGYSIDEAYDFFKAGKSAEQYVETIKARPNFSVRND